MPTYRGSSIQARIQASAFRQSSRSPANIPPASIKPWQLSADVPTVGAVSIQDEGVSKGNASILNLVGDGVAAVVAGVTATITVASAILKSILTTKGDLPVATASGVVDRLAAGSDGQALVADSAQTKGLKYVDREIRVVFVIPTDAGSTTVPKPGSPTLPACTITKVEVELDKNEACGATSLIVDIHKVLAANKNTDGQGTTMYSSATKPTISSGNRYVNAALPDVLTFAAGDSPKVYVDQAGTSTTYATVTITAKVSA